MTPSASRRVAPRVAPARAKLQSILFGPDSWAVSIRFAVMLPPVAPTVLAAIDESDSGIAAARNFAHA